MPEFTYEGVDKVGKRVAGRQDAPTEGDLRMILRGQGIRPTRIAKSTAMNSDLGSLLSGGQKKIPIEILVVFTRQLQVLINSGIPLMQSLEILVDQTSHAGMRAILGAVKEKVSRGSYLWEALAVFPRAFPRIFVALVRAGEASGSLDTMLKRLSRYIEDADRLRKMLKSAMMYPAIVVSIGVGVVVLMLVFVIPKFEDLLKQSNQELPLPTQIVIGTAHFLVNNIIFIVPGTAIVVYLMARYLRSPEGKALFDRSMFRAPLFGPLMQKAGVARFARTMSTLLSSGVNLIDAIEICRTVIDNAVLEAAVSKIKAEVETGKTLGFATSRLDVFPKMAYQMIQVGESTGNLDKMLEKVADFYEADVEALVGGLGQLIEPIVLVFLGGTVGGLMLAMYLPIFKLAGGSE